MRKVITGKIPEEYILAGAVNTDINIVAYKTKHRIAILTRTLNDGRGLCWGFCYFGGGTISAISPKFASTVSANEAIKNAVSNDREVFTFGNNKEFFEWCLT